VYADAGESDPKRRRIVREDLHPVEAEAIREAARRVLDFGEPVQAILKDWAVRGIMPVAAPAWTPASLVYTLTSPHIAGLREWQGQTYPATWPAIIDTDTHERLVKLFADPARRRHLVRRQQRLLGGIPRCHWCGHRMYYKPAKGRNDSYACVTGVGRGCGRIAITAQPLEEFVTGAVLDALESPRVQEALRDGTDASGPRRAELLAEIARAQETRDEARRDYSEGRIDRADWLDIRDRTEQRIRAARRDYDKLARVRHRAGRHSPLRTGPGRLGIVDHRPQARRDPRRPDHHHHSPACPRRGAQSRQPAEGSRRAAHAHHRHADQPGRIRLAGVTPVNAGSGDGHPAGAGLRCLLRSCRRCPFLVFISAASCAGGRLGQHGREPGHGQRVLDPCRLPLRGAG